MATNSPIVTSLPDYVEEQRLPLIAKSVLGAKSAGLFTLQTEVKGPTALNLISTDVVLGDGKECGWDAAGSTEHSQRVLSPAYLKVNADYCDKNLIGKWAQSQVTIAAGIKDMPFEEEFTNGIVEGVQEQVEKMIYFGDVDSSTGVEFDGLVKILEEDDVDTIDVSTGSTAYDKVKAVYMAMPEEVIEKDDAVILVGAGLYRSFIQDLVTANLYHYNPENDNEEYKLPGTNVRVIKVNGLNTTTNGVYAIGARLSNLFYGTNALGDEAKFDLWYSQDNREFRLAIEFTAGVQVAYPSEVVLGKWEA